MKVIRSSRCSLKFATEAKRAQLAEIMSEYMKVVNVFIDRFWNDPSLANKAMLLKEVLVIDGGFDYLVLENLLGITQNRKGKKDKQTGKLSIDPRRRRGRGMRRLLAGWNLGHVERGLESRAQMNRVHLRRVSPRYTSQTCSVCGHREQMNRVGSSFSCRGCGHADDADLNAAKNIAHRFISGPYGAGCELSGSAH